MGEGFDDNASRAPPFLISQVHATISRFAGAAWGGSLLISSSVDLSRWGGGETEDRRLSGEVAEGERV